MARPRPVFSARCTSLPLGVGSAGLATLAFAAPPPKGREVQEDKGNLQKHFYTPNNLDLYLNQVPVTGIVQTGLDGDGGLEFAISSSGNTSPRNFSASSLIDSSATFSGLASQTVFGLDYFGTITSSPNFGPNSYLGFRVQGTTSGTYYYGWMEVLWTWTGTLSTSSFEILSAGYESTLNTGILAGVGATPVPETSSAYPLALALGGVAIRQYRKRRQQQAASRAEDAVVAGPRS